MTRYLFVIAGIAAVVVSSCTTIDENTRYDRTTVERKFGITDSERLLGDTRYYRHTINMNNYEEIGNPKITIVKNGMLLANGRLKDVIDILADLEVSNIRTSATILEIEAFGIKLGDNIENYPDFVEYKINKDELVRVYRKNGDIQDWSTYFLKCDSKGIIQEITLVKRFDSYSGFLDFYFKLIDKIKSRFVEAKSSYDEKNHTYFYMIRGLPNEQALHRECGAILETILGDYRIIDINKELQGEFAYIVNPDLKSIFVLANEFERMIAMSVRSNKIESNIYRVNEYILDNM